ncbi:MAG: FAD-dependent oxidoreductase [Thermoplasmata archaeon]
MTTSEFDVAIVGAGIIGASCASECTRAGLRVVVIESGEPGGGTTSTNMGQIIVEDGSEAEFLLTRFATRLWRELAPELPPDAEFQRLGTIWVATDEEEMRAVERRKRFYSAHGVPAEVLSAEALRREEPNLRPGLAGGLWMPDDSVVTATAVTRMLLDRVRTAGGQVRSGRRVEALETSGVRLSGGEVVTALHAINAAGVAAPSLSPGVPVRPRKGHLAYTDARPGFLHHQLIEMGYVRRAQDIGTDSISFNVQPRPGGEIRVGSSRQLGLTELAPDPNVIRSMTGRAAEYMPRLAGFPILRTATGLRPASSDGLPLIGPWPRQEGVFLATGHEGLGITMSLATGRLVADQLVGHRSEIPIEPYLPGRILPHGETDGFTVVGRGREN